MIDQEEITFIKKTLAFWDNLMPLEQNLILANASLKSYQGGQTIHNGDQDCIGVLLIKSGELRTYILSEDGRDITLYRLGQGDVCILSASCILENITFDVHIDAEKKSSVILINPSIFQKICTQNIYAENFSYKTTIERFSDVMWAFEQILFMSFDQRLTIFLLDEISKTGSTVIAMTHEQIAKYVGSAREVVSRMLKYFEKEGFVKLSRGKIEVIDKMTLQKKV